MADTSKSQTSKRHKSPKKPPKDVQTTPKRESSKQSSQSSTQSRRKSNSDLPLNATPAPKVEFFAGANFQNSPEPSSLPIPVFNKKKPAVQNNGSNVSVAEPSPEILGSSLNQSSSNHPTANPSMLSRSVDSNPFVLNGHNTAHIAHNIYAHPVHQNHIPVQYPHPIMHGAAPVPYHHHSHQYIMGQLPIHHHPSMSVHSSTSSLMSNHYPIVNPPPPLKADSIFQMDDLPKDNDVSSRHRQAGNPQQRPSSNNSSEPISLGNNASPAAPAGRTPFNPASLDLFNQPQPQHPYGKPQKSSLISTSQQPGFSNNVHSNPPNGSNLQSSSQHGSTNLAVDLNGSSGHSTSTSGQQKDPVVLAQITADLRNILKLKS